jgi:hypothetical protein
VDNHPLAAEVDRNYDYFQRNLATFMQDHAGEYAVLKARKVVKFFKRPGDAYQYAVSTISDGIFSVQEVTDEPIDLGFFSHVAP